MIITYEVSIDVHFNRGSNIAIRSGKASLEYFYTNWYKKYYISHFRLNLSVCLSFRTHTYNGMCSRN